MQDSLVTLSQDSPPGSRCRPNGEYTGDITNVSIEDLELCSSTFQNLTVRCSFGSIRCIDYSENRHLLVVGEKNRGARIVFPDTYGSVQFGGDETVRAAVFSPDGEYAFTGGDDRIVRMWRVKAMYRESANSSANGGKVKPSAALEVKPLGPLWGDTNKFHHSQKVRSMSCCNTKDGNWLLSSVCEGGRVNLWTFSNNGKAISHLVWDSRTKGFASSDGSVSWNAVSFISEANLLVTAGREKSPDGQRRGIVHVYDPRWLRQGDTTGTALIQNSTSTTKLLLEVTHNINNATHSNSTLEQFEAGWSLGQIPISGSRESKITHCLLVGDYNRRIHIFDLSVREITDKESCPGDLRAGYSDERCFEVDMLDCRQSTVSETKASGSDTSKVRVFDIALAVKHDRHIAACLGDGSVLVAKICEREGKVSTLEWQKCSSHAPLRARCGTFVETGSDTNSFYLISGGFDHRLIKRRGPFECDKPTWQREGSSSGISAIAVSSAEDEKSRLAIFTVGQSHKPEQDDVLLWVNELQSKPHPSTIRLSYWKKKWSSINPSYTDKRATNAKDSGDQRSHHCLLTVRLSDGLESIITGGAYGLVERIVKTRDAYRSSDESTPTDVSQINGDLLPTHNKHVWDISFMHDFVFAACEDGHVYAIRLSDGKLLSDVYFTSDIDSGDVVRTVATQDEFLLAAAGVDNQRTRLWRLEVDDDSVMFQNAQQLEGPNLGSPNSWVTALEFSEANESSDHCYLAAAHEPSGAEKAIIKVYKIPRTTDNISREHNSSVDEQRSETSEGRTELIIPTQHSRRITRLLFVDRQTLISASEDGFACVWYISEDLKSGTSSPDPKIHSSKKHLFEKRLSPIRHDVGIVDMAIAPSESDQLPRFLVTADRNGEVRVWNLELMKSWFDEADNRSGYTDNNNSSNTDDSGDQSESKPALRFTEGNITRLIRSDDHNAEAICRGAGLAFTSFTQTRLYEGARFRNTKWKYEQLKTSFDYIDPSSGDGISSPSCKRGPYEVDEERQEVNIQNMANDLAFLGADFISSCHAKRGSNDKPENNGEQHDEAA